MSYPGKYLSHLKDVIDKIDTADVEEVIEILASAKEEGRKVFVIGNGGSASTSSHLVTDMTKGAYKEGGSNFAAISLCDNTSIITALGNDFSFEDIFVGQLRAYFSSGDVVIAISASGNSPNVIKAVEYANQNGGVTIGLSAFTGGKLKELSKKSVHIPVDHYGLAEDAHMIVSHIIVYYFMEQAGNMKPL